MTMTPETKTAEQIEKVAEVIYRHSETTDDGLICMGCDADMGGDQAAHQAEMLRAAGLLVAGAPTEEQIERAAKGIFDIRDDQYDDREWEELDSADRELYICQARAALTAAGVAPQAEHYCESCEDCASSPGHDRCCGCYDGVCCKEAASPAPTPDREKLIAEALEEASFRSSADDYYGQESDAEAAAKAAGYNAAMETIEPYVKQLAALASSPVVAPDAISIPRPVVPFGPKGLSGDEATAHYLREVDRKISTGFITVGGSNVTAAVRKMLADVVLALKGGR